MKMTKYAIALAVILLLLMPISVHSQDRLDQEIETLKTNARIDHGAVTAPTGKLLLARRGNVICAIRFTEFHRAHDAKPGTVFHSGDETLSAHYDWACQPDGSNDLKKKNTLGGSGKLVSKPLVGIGRLAFQTGNEEIKCGPFKLFWYFPTFVAFSPTLGNCSGSEVELSPTKWVSVEQIDFSLPSLKWYRCDSQRRSVYVPIDEL